MHVEQTRERTESEEHDIALDLQKAIISQIWGRHPAFRRIKQSGGNAFVSVLVLSWSRVQTAEFNAETMLFLTRYGLDLRLTLHYQNTDEPY